MFRAIYLYFRLVGISFRSQMQHRSSFLMLTTAFFISTFVDIFGIWVLFDRFKVVKGWSLEEVALLYGVMHMGFGIAEAVARGFDSFSILIKNGDFDRVLLRPLGTFFQIATRELQMIRLGRVLQGLVVLSWAFGEMQFSFFSMNLLVIVLSIVGTACLFYGLFVLQGTLTFWTTESLEIMNITTFGGLETGQYPMNIYHPSFRFVFTFIIPIACVAYYPVATMLHQEVLPYFVGIYMPLFGVAFLYMSTKIWEFGVRKYHSTGN